MKAKDRENLIRVWDALGIRRLWLAKQAQIDRSRLSRWENGHIELTEDEIARIWEITDSVVSEKSNARQLPFRKTRVTVDAVEMGKVVAKLRTSYGITQAELAERARIDRSSLSLFENGYSNLDRRDVAGIEKALDSMVAERQGDRGRMSLFELMGEPPKRSVTLGAVEPEKKEPVLKGFDSPQVASDVARAILHEVKNLSGENKKLTEANVELERALALHKKIGDLKDELIEAFKGRLAELEAEAQVTKEQLGALREWLDSEMLAAVANEDAEKKRESAHRLAATASEKE